MANHINNARLLVLTISLFLTCSYSTVVHALLCPASEALLASPFRVRTITDVNTQRKPSPSRLNFRRCRRDYASSIRSAQVLSAITSEASPEDVNEPALPLVSASMPRGSSTDWKADHLPNDDGGRGTPVVEMGPETMLRDWFPLSFESYLDSSIPNPILHMGRNLAVWRDKNGDWYAQDDMCPHKLAPLSDGSVAEDGVSLRCSYHGWRFDGSGTCTAIPSLPRDAPIPSRCSVRSYPVRRTGEMLWIWMDPSVEPDWDCPRLRHAQGAWNLNNGYQREVAYSWDYLFENILDPTHVAYSHFGVGKGFNRTEVDEIRDDHLMNLSTMYTNDGVQLKFNRTINGRNANETWDFLYPGVWFLRRSPGSDRGAGMVIMASPIGTRNTRLMTAQYNPEKTKTKENAFGKLKTKLMRPITTVLLHTFTNRFFNSDAFLIRYQQEMVASGQNPRDPLRDYELASPADQGTVAFRRWHLKRLGGRLPMARPLVPESGGELGSISQPADPSGPVSITREEAADPWEQHSKNCPSCRGAHNLAKRVKMGSAIMAALVVVLRPVIGTGTSVVGSLALSILSLRAHRFASSFHKKGHVHGTMKAK